MDALVTQLEKEVIKGNKVKQNNTVNGVIDCIIAFLSWVQTTGNPFDHSNLVGLAGTASNLEVSLGKNHFGRQSLRHSRHLEKNTPLYGKVAMPREIITRVENQIFNESDPEIYAGDVTHKLNSGSKRMALFQQYLYERRTFSIWMFKKAGLRPDELCQMPLSKNINIMDTLVLWLPTKKRRTDNPSLRLFKITSDGALAVKHYLDARSEYLAGLGTSPQKNASLDRMLLTEQGSALAVGSLTRDFSRLVNRAGLHDVRACLSMFRHRFITMEIMVHLKQITKTDRPTRGMLSAAVVKSIEERIRKKTGHKLGQSIWTYFDAAFDMMSFWGSVDRTLSQVDRLNDIEDKANRIKYNLRNDPEEVSTVKEDLAALLREIAEIRSQLGVAN